MKKAIAVVIIFLIFILIFILQANFFSWFTIAGVKPNIFIILVVFLGLFAGQKLGTIYGIILGIILDIVLGRNIAIGAIMLGITGFFGGYLDKNFSKESRLTVMLMMIGATAVYEIGTYLFSIIEFSINIEIISFIKILLIEIFYNAILTIIIYPLIQKLGYKLEDIYKEQKILTRYF